MSILAIKSDKLGGKKMKIITNLSPLLKEAELRKKPVVIRVNKFNEESAKNFNQSVSLAHNTGQPVIPVIIDSYGGEVYSLMSMISAIKASEVPIATIVEGKAMSCGAIYGSPCNDYDT
jgi:membrane-bound ClpP family serine protease